MRHFNKERIKSIIITGLIISSLIQVGILWGYQSHGTPTNIFPWFFGRQNQGLTDEEVRDKLFTPVRLILSNGESSHWVIGREDDLFKQTYKEAKGYLRDIIEGKLTRTAPKENWGEISKKQGFLLEFGAEISPELLGWFTAGVSKAAGDVPPLYKMMIKPDSVDESLCEVFIIDAEDNVSEYSVNNVSRSRLMEKIFSVYEDKSDTYRNYTFMSDLHLDRYSNRSFEPDVLYATRSPQYWLFNQIQVSIPLRVTKENELGDIMLGKNEKDRYIKSPGNDFLQFSNKESTYKVYKSGDLTYKLLEETDASEKGDVGAALMNAYSFASKLNKLTNQKAEIYLSGIDYDQRGYYSFNFDYKFNEMPVVVNLGSKSADDGIYRNAFTIDANGARVLSCSCILREFTQGPKLSYNDRFTDIMSFHGINNYSQMKITDISNSYYLNGQVTDIIEPSLVVRLKDKQTPQAYSMLQGKGG